MERAYWSSTIEDFLKTTTENIKGQLLNNDVFQTTDPQKGAWEREITILKKQLEDFKHGNIIFEYTIPRIGHRIDVVCIINGIIFLLEFKAGDKKNKYEKSTDDQVMDYALDLKYFHEMSLNKYIVPINVSIKAPEESFHISIMNDRILEVNHCNESNIGSCIKQILTELSDEPIDINKWIESRYSPTPTIIEAAQAMYRNHSVEDIHRKEAENLSDTTKAIDAIIDSCKKNHKKAICFVTGVPGAGKTLAGLNIASSRHEFQQDEHAVFLSGNGPLVDVLQDALARDQVKRQGVKKKDALRQAKSFIQIIHKFRDEALTSTEPISERIAIFDEAQRAWDKEQLSSFMKTKKKRSDFNQSEPDFLISIMDRHKDWATIICLVGGGQEIYNGEAGIEDWFKALGNNYFDWDIYISDKMTDSEYISGTTVSALLNGRKYNIESSLHLSVPLRSFRSEQLSAFTKAVLDNEKDKANSIYGVLKDKYPIFITRDFNKAKEWIKTAARGSERYGLLASSCGKRLRAEGIWVQPSINHIAWFLEDKNHIESSYYLEVAASEFKVQGLEIDYALLAWDVDFRYENGKFNYYKISKGKQWSHVNDERSKKYMKNAYRVLMTRARQGMIIFVPEGTDPAIDPSRDKKYYDGVYDYLISCGIRPLD